MALVEEKRFVFLAYKTYPSIRNRENLRIARRKMQKEARRCAQSYWLDLCDEIQRAADMGDTQRMYEGIKRFNGRVKGQ